MHGAKKNQPILQTPYTPCGTVLDFYYEKTYVSLYIHIKSIMKADERG